MKDISDLTVCVCDYGFFISVAQKFAEKAKKVYYHSPVEDEFQAVQKCIMGDGLPNVERLDDFLAPSTFDQIDLFVFPDEGFGNTQEYLRRAGKLVWGSMHIGDLEQSRTRFMDMVKSLGLPSVPSVRLQGLSALSDHLKKVKDKFVKINRFRSDMETFLHEDWEHSEREIERLAKRWGGMKEYPIFLVQDKIPNAQEVGYDGWSVDGQFPVRGFAGYEDKDELYLGALREYSQLPKQVRQVNTAISPVLEDGGYRNFIATEIRMQNGVPYFIDPTFRMPGLTGEQLLETCDNLFECCAYGADAQLIEPEFNCKFVTAANLHYTAGDPGDWKVLRVAEEVSQWTKLWHFVFDKDLFHFPPEAMPPGKSPELGLVIGVGDTFDEALKHLKSNLDYFKNEPVLYKTDGFYDLIKAIKKAEEEGIEFSDDAVPDEFDALAAILE